MGVAFKENTFHMMTTGIIKQFLVGKDLTAGVSMMNAIVFLGFNACFV